ncbi:MAG TPA: His/Gly/Thr/Pro-type tRNA ligase C-terminal domain-containing protein [Natronosporangium sp.]
MSGGGQQAQPRYPGFADLRRVGFLVQQDEAPAGHWSWLPLGAEFCRILLDVTARRLAADGYEQVDLPSVVTLDSPRLAGSLQKFGDRIYRVDADPPAGLAWNSDHLSFSLLRQLALEPPVRMFTELDFYRRERSGEVGLRRGRSFSTLDVHAVLDGLDAGLAEFGQLLQLCHGLLADLLTGGWWLDVSADASQRPALQPSIDLFVKGSDVPARVEWFEEPTNYYALQVKVMAGAGGKAFQLSNLQLDLVNGPRYELGEGTAIVHAAPVARPERFATAMLLAMAGRPERPAWPMTVSPVQVRLLPVRPDAVDRAVSVAQTWRAAGLRIDVDAAATPVPKRLRWARRQLIPYIGLVGAADDPDQLRVEGPDGGGQPLATVATRALAASDFVVSSRLPVICRPLSQAG